MSNDIVQAHSGGIHVAGAGASFSGTLAAVVGTSETLKAFRTFIFNDFKKGLDYGPIPGTRMKLKGADGKDLWVDKSSLLQPGAIKTFMFFNCYPVHRVQATEHGGGHVEYVVYSDIVSRVTGHKLGEGVGSCSTMETKYRFRKAKLTCPKCRGEAITESKKAGGGWYCNSTFKGGCGAEFKTDDQTIKGQELGQVENANPHDQRNTVLKMAKKRANVDAALMIGCMHEYFTQDLDETDRYDVGSVFDQFPDGQEAVSFGEYMTRSSQPVADEPVLTPKREEKARPPSKPKVPIEDSRMIGWENDGEDPRPYRQVAADAAAEAMRQLKAVSKEVDSKMITAAMIHAYVFGAAVELTFLPDLPKEQRTTAKALEAITDRVYPTHRAWVRDAVDSFVTRQLEAAKEAMLPEAGDDETGGKPLF